MSKVQVMFPGGRKAWLDPKTATGKTVVKMGGRIINEPAPIVVPKVYSKPVVQVIEEVPEVPEVDFTTQFVEEVEEAKEPKATAKKPLGRPKKSK